MMSTVAMCLGYALMVIGGFVLWAFLTVLALEYWVKHRHLRAAVLGYYEDKLRKARSAKRQISPNVTESDE